MTLIEVMIVMVIIGIFTAITFPTLRGVHQRGKLGAGAREFALLARFARQQAILRGKTTELRRLYRVLASEGIGRHAIVTGRKR